MKIKAPTYTQTPNELFDEWLPHLGEAELKVLLVIMRKTFGWHKIRDRISISQLTTITGLERRNVIKATQTLQEKGLILKEVLGPNGTQETYYELIIEENSNNLDQCRKDTPPSVAKTPPPSVEKTPTKETNLKETYQKKTTTQHTLLPVVVSFYECLKDSKLTDDEKMILNKFPEEEVKKAHEFIKANYEYPNTTWIQLYIWAVKYKPKTTKAKEDNIPKNKELSDMVEKIKDYPYRIESLKEGLEFSSPSGQTIEIIPYDINADEFYGKIASRLRLTAEQLHEKIQSLR